VLGPVFHDWTYFTIGRYYQNFWIVITKENGLGKIYGELRPELYRATRNLKLGTFCPRLALLRI